MPFRGIDLSVTVESSSFSSGFLVQILAGGCFITVIFWWFCLKTRTYRSDYTETKEEEEKKSRKTRNFCVCAGWGSGHCCNSGRGGLPHHPRVHRCYQARQNAEDVSWILIGGKIWWAWCSFSGYLRLCSIVADRLPAGLVQETRPPSEDTIALFFFFFLGFCLRITLFFALGMSCNQSLDGSFPPSPAEDRGAQRLSWSSLLQKLTELKGHNLRGAEDQYCGSETGECQRKVRHWNVLQSPNVHSYNDNKGFLFWIVQIHFEKRQRWFSVFLPPCLMTAKLHQRFYVTRALLHISR